MRRWTKGYAVVSATSIFFFTYKGYYIASVSIGRGQVYGLSCMSMIPASQSGFTFLPVHLYRGRPQVVYYSYVFSAINQYTH